MSEESEYKTIGKKNFNFQVDQFNSNAQPFYVLLDPRDDKLLIEPKAYDTNIESGGRGARTLGIGHQASYRRDVVTVSLRGISTLTGEVLLNVQSKKTILSVGSGFDVFKFG